MDIGICLPQLGSQSDGARVAEFASTAERLGYRSLWVGDRVLTPLQPTDLYPLGGTPEHPYPPEFTAALDPLITLTAAAVATSTVRLGTSTVNAIWHTPLLLARAVTSLDLISNGRLVLGLGLGWMRDEYHAVGVSWTGKSERFDETLDVLRTLWTENPVEHHGPLFDIPLSAVDLRPAQVGGPPVLLAGFSEASMRRIGRRAQGWVNSSDMPAEYAAYLWSIARSAAVDAGRDPDALHRETRINIAEGQSIDSVASTVEALAADGVDGAFVDLHYSTRSVDEATDIAARIADRLGLETAAVAV
ncbi:TIGR03619 family F420-dependent LLM class oxidoreductase [Rhodococcus sp. Eu-32]|uniref:TIGR03619 family F420-dependent LLM class oxidoreductase n=1 Tax=Rhodococcus sp. Eu-32 TaxID=1017319 RepID=UPI000DF43B8E|nr:TIGR03619 family F420-dependent LLM class oxidoreductase [Rhodococcus sp. Eu-32]RRQ26263.1 TIGR03619 family F420-dependent LLM class oxidoreductase [Rhodococcus sp. Eu-32]